MSLTLTSPAFADGGPIPGVHTCDGRNLQPALQWSGVPAGTRTLALIVHDPDAPRGDFTHWLLYDIPTTVNMIPESPNPTSTGVPGANDFGREGYGGPCPPTNHGSHRYVFTLYALDLPAGATGLNRGANRAAVEDAIQGHILDQATLTGVFARR